MPVAEKFLNPDELTNVQALASFDGKTLMPRYHYMDVLAREHAVAFSVAKMMDEDMLADVQSALTDALANSTDFDVFKKRMEPYLMAKGWWGKELVVDPLTGDAKKVQLGSTRRLRTIYHTNLHASYAAGQWQRIQETKRGLPYLQYMPSVAGKQRDKHKQYYGIVRPVDDPIWQMIMPPNGYGCLCWVKQLTRSQARRAGISDEVELEMVDVENPRTGETMRVPAGLDPSFAHNHDRLTAARQMQAEKIQGSKFVPSDDKAKAQAAATTQLNNYMSQLIFNPVVKKFAPNVSTASFDARINAFARASDSRAAEMIGIARNTTESHQWAVATLSSTLQETMDIKKYVAWMGEDTLLALTRAAKNSAEDVIELLHTTRDMLNNADELITLDDGGYKALFISKGKRYQATLAVDKVTDTLNIIDLAQI